MNTINEILNIDDRFKVLAVAVDNNKIHVLASYYTRVECSNGLTIPNKRNNKTK